MRKLLILIFSFAVGLSIYADGFMFLEVDGIKVTITDIIFGKNYANSETTASISLNRTVDLTGNPNDVFEGGISLMLERGYDNLNYDHINIDMSGGVAIKGYAYDEDNTRFIYTKTSGIGILAGSTWSEPSDYDYLQKDYLYYAGDNGNQNETTFINSEVSYDPVAGIDIKLLVDTYKVAYYWDGTHAARHGFVETWNLENSSYFPSGTAVIGLTYLPFYVAVNRNVISETYVVASSSTPLAGLPTVVDEKNSMFVTLVFDADAGDFYIGRTANWDSLDDYNLDLPQFIRTGTLSGGSYNFSLSSYKQESGGWTNNQTISGFTRATNVGDPVDTASVNSGEYTLYYYRVD